MAALKGITQKWKIVIIYSTCHSKPIRLWLIFKTQLQYFWSNLRGFRPSIDSPGNQNFLKKVIKAQ